MYQLTCRAQERGRGLTPVVAHGTPDPATVGLDRWIIFVHGFNNSKKVAAATWRATVQKLILCRVDMGAVVLFYWPGDYSRWQVVSAMNYPKCVPIAEETAQRLAAYLQSAAQDRQVPLQLSFVAHSLGSLVVLETIRLLRAARANVMVHDSLLMAAAVPEGFCIRGEAYGDPFSLDTNEVTLYSLDDGILKKFFQVGQEIAKRFPETRRRAVGRSGGPGAGRGQRWTSALHMEGFGHGDYWNKPASIAEIARIVAATNGNSVDPSGGGEEQGQPDAIHQDALATDVLDVDDYIPPEIMFRWLVRPIDI